MLPALSQHSVKDIGPVSSRQSREKRRASLQTLQWFRIGWPMADHGFRGV
jgi:hypothetical protein